MQTTDAKKKIAWNAVYNAIYSTLDIAFPLVTTPYLSRILLADGIGRINYAKNITAWFVAFASLGIPIYGTREVARAKKNNESLNKITSELFVINMLCTSFCMFVYILVINSIPFFKERKLLLLITGIRLALNVFSVDWFYKGIENYGYITRRSFTIKLLSLIAIFIFVRAYSDYYCYAAIQSIAIAGNNLFNFAHMRKYCRFDFKDLNYSRHIKPILVLLATYLAVNVYALLDTTMLGVLCSDTVVGYYTNCHKIIGTITSLTASLSAVLLPQLVVYFEAGDIATIKNVAQKALSVIVMICAPASIGLALVSRELVTVYLGSNFLPCIKTMILFAPFVLITTIGNLFGTQLLMTFNKEKEMLISVLVGVVSNITFNSLLIRKYMQDGATIASVVTELVVMIVQVYLVNREITITWNMKSIQRSLLSSLVMSIVVMLVKYLCDGMFVKLLLSIVLGSGTYFAMCYVTKNEALYFILSILKQNKRRKGRMAD